MVLHAHFTLHLGFGFDVPSENPPPPGLVKDQGFSGFFLLPSLWPKLTFVSFFLFFSTHHSLIKTVNIFFKNDYKICVLENFSCCKWRFFLQIYTLHFLLVSCVLFFFLFFFIFYGFFCVWAKFCLVVNGSYYTFSSVFALYSKAVVVSGNWVKEW